MTAHGTKGSRTTCCFCAAARHATTCLSVCDVHTCTHQTAHNGWLPGTSAQPATCRCDDDKQCARAHIPATRQLRYASHIGAAALSGSTESKRMQHIVHAAHAAAEEHQIRGGPRHLHRHGNQDHDEPPQPSQQAQLRRDCTLPVGPRTARCGGTNAPSMPTEQAPMC